MGLFLNVVVLIFEVLYYAMFMKFARKEGKFSRYLLLFIIDTIMILLFDSTRLPTYLIFVLITYCGLKFIVKTKVSLYDMLIIIIMLFVNILIQFPIYVLFYNILSINHFGTTIIFELVKILLIHLCQDMLNKMYIKLKYLWDNNNFYIRYIFSCSMFIYVIITVALLIKLIWEV